MVCGFIFKNNNKLANCFFKFFAKWLLEIGHITPQDR